MELRFCTWKFVLKWFKCKCRVLRALGRRSVAKASSLITEDGKIHSVGKGMKNTLSFLRRTPFCEVTKRSLAVRVCGEIKVSYTWRLARRFKLPPSAAAVDNKYSSSNPKKIICTIVADLYFPVFVHRYHASPHAIPNEENIFQSKILSCTITYTHNLPTSVVQLWALDVCRSWFRFPIGPIWKRAFVNWFWTCVRVL